MHWRLNSPCVRNMSFGHLVTSRDRHVELGCQRSWSTQSISPFLSRANYFSIYYVSIVEHTFWAKYIENSYWYICWNAMLKIFHYTLTRCWNWKYFEIVDRAPFQHLLINHNKISFVEISALPIQYMIASFEYLFQNNLWIWRLLLAVPGARSRRQIFNFWSI